MLRKVIFVSCLICFAFCADVYQVATYASTDCTGAFIGVRIIGSGYVRIENRLLFSSNRCGLDQQGCCVR